MHTRLRADLRSDSVQAAGVGDEGTDGRPRPVSLIPSAARGRRRNASCFRPLRSLRSHQGDICVPRSPPERYSPRNPRLATLASTRPPRLAPLVETKPSITPATTRQTTAAPTMRTARRPAITRASPRRRSPGAGNASARAPAGAKSFLAGTWRSTARRLRAASISSPTFGSVALPEARFAPTNSNCASSTSWMRML